MRQIDNKVMDAFRDDTSFKSGNTEVDTGSLYLHGNMIATKKGNTLILGSCGWLTNVTKARLNAVLMAFNLDTIASVKGIWMLGDKPFKDGMKLKV